MIWVANCILRVSASMTGQRTRWLILYWIDLIQLNLRSWPLLSRHEAVKPYFRGAQNMIANAWQGLSDHIANSTASVFSGASCAIPPIGGSV